MYGLVCSGYDVFRSGLPSSGNHDRKGQKQSGKLVRKTEKEETWKSVKISPRLRASALPHTLSIPPEQLASNFFFFYTQSQRLVKTGPVFLTECISETSTSPLGRALEAAALSFLTLNRKYAAYETLAYRRYGQAVTSVREELQRPPKRFSEKLMMAIWLLGMFEVCHILYGQTWDRVC